MGAVLSQILASLLVSFQQMPVQSTPPSAVARVLAIPELLHAILRFIPLRDTSPLLVDSTWCACYMPIFFHTVVLSEPQHILALLGGNKAALARVKVLEIDSSGAPWTRLEVATLRRLLDKREEEVARVASNDTIGEGRATTASFFPALVALRLGVDSPSSLLSVLELGERFFTSHLLPTGELAFQPPRRLAPSASEHHLVFPETRQLAALVRRAIASTSSTSFQITFDRTFLHSPQTHPTQPPRPNLLLSPDLPSASRCVQEVVLLFGALRPPATPNGDGALTLNPWDRRVLLVRSALLGGLSGKVIVSGLGSKLRDRLQVEVERSFNNVRDPRSRLVFDEPARSHESVSPEEEVLDIPPLYVFVSWCPFFDDSDRDVLFHQALSDSFTPSST